MQAHTKNNSQDVFSWDKLCNLFDDKLKDVARKSDLVPIKADIEEFKEENQKLKNHIKKLSSRLEFIDRKSRSSNVVLSGLGSTNINAAKADFLKLSSEVLELNNNIISTRMIAGGKSFYFTLETNSHSLNEIKRN